MEKVEAMRIHEYGDATNFKLDRMELPDPAPDEVSVKQHAIGVNFIDVYHRKGVFPIPSLPGAVGVEAAGEVIAVGSDITQFQPGDRVAYAGPPVGSYVTARNISGSSLVCLPDTISYEGAASIMLKGMTVQMLMTKVRPLFSGETILVHAAAGGLGSLLCQWAASLGVRVIGTVGSEKKVSTAKSVGCSDVILYKEQDFVSAVMDITQNKGIDVVYEGIGGDTLTKSLDCLKPFGHAINLGQVGNPLQSMKLADLGPARSLSVSVPGIFAYLRICDDLQKAADEMFAMFTSGKISAQIGDRFKLSDVTAAHQKLEAGATTGAVILLP